MIRPLTALALGVSAVAASDVPKAGGLDAPIAPPPAMERVDVPDAPRSVHPRTQLWSIGEPTDQEQYYLELINRARANPAAEGQRLAATTDPDVLSSYSYFGVNLSKMQQEMSALPAAPPLAMNEKLLQSSQAHTDDQFTNKFQGHVGSNGSTMGARLAAVGYSASSYGENVFAYSKSSWYGHAGFEVDWGSGSGGMQDGRGHRTIIHGGFREVGIGIREGTNGSGQTAVGPQVVTQDFGIPAGSAVPMVTGVAFYDLNGNNFYDPGEGIGGVTVNVSGSSWHGVTAGSGGYAVPAPSGTASRTVTFSGLGFNTPVTASIVGTDNVRVDLKPAWSPQPVEGPGSPVINTGNTYSLPPVAGATTYDWRAMRKIFAATDGANDLTRVIASVSGYPAVTTGTKQEGTGSYHLAQPSARNETITYKAVFLGLTTPVLRYQSRLAAATTGQKAYVQVSTDGGLTWITVDTQTGTGGNGQSGFSLRTVALSGMAGREFMLRFSFTLSGTTFYTSTNNSTGWFVDAVSFTDILDTTGAAVSSTGGTATFTFTPAETGAWLLSSRALNGSRVFPFGPVREVTAITAPPPPVYSSWCAPFENSLSLLAGTLSGSPAADFNKDGIPNLMAYALDLSPVIDACDQLPQPVAASGTLRLDYSRHTDRNDVSLTPQVSTDLRTWYNPGQAGAPAGFTDTLQSTSGVTQTRRASVPLVQGQHYYLRLRAVKL